MSNKPRIRCPHCEEHIEAQRLPGHRKYRNRFGLDVFDCPECHREFKVEPTEYFVAKEGIEKGTISSEAAIAAVKVNECLPSEMLVSNYDRSTRAPWRKPMLTIAIVAALIAVYLIFR